MATKSATQITLPFSESNMGQMGLGKVTISKQFRFEASHVLPRHKGKCSRLHGHSWVLSVEIDGYVDDETGFVADYGDLKDLVNDLIINVVDHQHLGQGDRDWSSAVLGRDFYPSSENLILHFATILIPQVSGLGCAWQDVALRQLKLNETCTSECTWRRQDVR